MPSTLAKVEALYERWNTLVGEIDPRTQNGLGYQEALREATVALGTALGLLDIENPITPGEESVS